MSEDDPLPRRTLLRAAAGAAFAGRLATADAPTVTATLAGDRDLWRYDPVSPPARLRATVRPADRVTVGFEVHAPDGRVRRCGPADDADAGTDARRRGGESAATAACRVPAGGRVYVVVAGRGDGRYRLTVAER